MKQYSQKQIKNITEKFQQGQKAIQAKRFDLAGKCYLEILKIDANILEAQNALAFVYTFSKQHAKAVAQLNTILKLTPSDANAHYNLANNLYELNNYDEAIEHYQVAIKINPTLIDSYTQCGMVYHKLMQFDIALQYLNSAYALNNESAKILHGLGIIYAEIEDYPRALEFVSRAVKLAPNNMEYNLALAKILEKADLAHEADIQFHHTCNTFPNYLEAFVAYGELLNKNRYYDEALECFNHAKTLSPHQPDILDSIGNIYLGLADVDMAINQFNLALENEPGRLSSLMGIGQAYQEAGREVDAIALCDRIIALDDSEPAGYVLKSRVRKSKTDDGLAEQLLKLVTLGELSNSQKIPVNFALGKIYDDQKNYAQAFKYYAAGNTLKATENEYDQAAIDGEFSAITEFFNADFFQQHQHLGSDSDLPIIIVGMPRSGTTLTEQIISSHPEVSGAGEVIYWLPLTKGMSKKLNSELAYPQCLNSLAPIHTHEIVKRYEQTLRKITGLTSGSRHITDKMPHNFLTLGFIALLFPKAKIIHTKRDSIDTCLSIFFQNFSNFHSYSFDLTRLGAYYKQYERIMQHWHSVLPGRIMDITYADTIADPEYWSRRLIKHVGLEWNDACLTPHKLERSVKTASHWQVRQPIYKTSVERWRNYEEFLAPLKQGLKD